MIIAHFHNSDFDEGQVLEGLLNDKAHLGDALKAFRNTGRENALRPTKRRQWRDIPI